MSDKANPGVTMLGFVLTVMLAYYVFREALTMVKWTSALLVVLVLGSMIIRYW